MCLWFHMKSLAHWHSQDTVMDFSANIVRSKQNRSSESACLHKHPCDLCHKLDVKHRSDINLQQRFAEDNDSSKFFSNNVPSNDAICTILKTLLDLSSWKSVWNHVRNNYERTLIKGHYWLTKMEYSCSNDSHRQIKGWPQLLYQHISVSMFITSFIHMFII